MTGAGVPVDEGLRNYLESEQMQVTGLCLDVVPFVCFKDWGA